VSSFREFVTEGHRWITAVDNPFYPDTLEAAVALYHPHLTRFRQLTSDVDTPAALLRAIHEEPRESRIQLLRIFRKYVSPGTPVEMLKRKRNTDEIIDNFGGTFRDLDTVRRHLAARPEVDEALIAVLDEYRDRGSKGYALTESFFAWFEASDLAEAGWTIEGPVRAGRDVNLPDVLPGYPPKPRLTSSFAIPRGASAWSVSRGMTLIEGAPRRMIEREAIADSNARYWSSATNKDLT
jgi:hypothetical protein